MNKKELEAFAKQAAKGIKSEQDLTDFRKLLTKITVEAALSAELEEHLGTHFMSNIISTTAEMATPQNLFAPKTGKLTLKRHATENAASSHNQLKRTKRDSRQQMIKFCTCMPKA